MPIRTAPSSRYQAAAIPESGAQAALPIWTQYMKAALAGHPNTAFDVPEGVSFTDVDPETGKLATPLCPKRVNEAFLSGTEPTESCPLHR
jgi:membrane carboxypeptidase/penicillin-binding protein